jgi:hypothetical protein
MNLVPDLGTTHCNTGKNLLQDAYLYAPISLSLGGALMWTPRPIPKFVTQMITQLRFAGLSCKPSCTNGIFVFDVVMNHFDLQSR